MPEARFFLANAFATQPQGGNQAAIVLLGAGDSRFTNDDWCRAIGKDFGAPMTAIVQPVQEGPEPVYGMRWWTASGQESRLCGHATLATSFVLLTRIHQASTVHYDTLAGRLTANLLATGEIAISLPLGGPAAPSARSGEFAQLVATASGLSLEDIETVATYDNDRSTVVRVKASVDLEGLQVDSKQLYPTIEHYCIITQVVGAGESGVRINSRVFVEGMGIPEDPVTGSAHATLAQYYLVGHATDAIKPFSQDVAATTLDARQVSSRGGALKVSLEGERVRVEGKVFLWGEGTLFA